jgi:hypothetical protein
MIGLDRRNPTVHLINHINQRSSVAGFDVILVEYTRGRKDGVTVYRRTPDACPKEQS